MVKLLERLFEVFQRKCKHPTNKVKFDILEGQYKDFRIMWCERCGAFQFVYVNPSDMQILTRKEWRSPRATW